MANTANTGIKNSWSLIAFAQSHGKMQVGQFVNKETGETWKSCIFTDPKNDDNNTNKTFVAFSRNLGELTPKEIAQQKEDLQVVLCETKDGNDMYALCLKGQNVWEDVDLGL